MLEERKGKEQKIGRASEFGRVTAAGDVERLHPAIYFPFSFSAAAIVRATEFVFEQYDFLRSYIHERFYRDRAVLEQYFAFFSCIYLPVLPVRRLPANIENAERHHIINSGLNKFFAFFSFYSGNSFSA